MDEKLKMNEVIVDGQKLTIDEVIHVGLHPEVTVKIDQICRKKMREFRNALEKMIDDGKKIYGVTTGCGSRKDEFIPRPKLLDYQVNYVKTHACGGGDPLPKEYVRAMMLLRVNSFCVGNSAMTLEICDLIVEMLNRNIVPVIPRFGSVGASGDLVPLAHLGMALACHEGAKVYYKDTICEASEAFINEGLTPHIFQAKEAMGLTNGCTLILARACFYVRQAENLINTANVSAALNLEAVRGEIAAFDERIHLARHHAGQIHIAKEIRHLVAGSRRMTKAAQETLVCKPEDALKIYSMERVQDAYSLRCLPSAHGVAWEALKCAEEAVQHEVNSSTDNPLIFIRPDGEFDSLSGGNFHGDPLAVPLETLGLTLTKLASISERRFYNLLDSRKSYGLPGDLVGSDDYGMNGLMISQYAAAADVALCMTLCFPSTALSIPTSAGQEDYVSMGSVTAWKLGEIIERVTCVLARELHAACQGISLGEKKLGELSKLGQGTQKAYDLVRSHFPAMGRDRYYKPEIDKLVELIKNQDFF